MNTNIQITKNDINEIIDWHNQLVEWNKRLLKYQEWAFCNINLFLSELPPLLPPPNPPTILSLHKIIDTNQILSPSGLSTDSNKIQPPPGLTIESGQVLSPLGLNYVLTPSELINDTEQIQLPPGLFIETNVVSSIDTNRSLKSNKISPMYRNTKKCFKTSENVYNLEPPPPPPPPLPPPPPHP